jgi:transcriptional regulator with XRE-family HTH domain
MADDAKAIGRRILRYRKEKGMSATELAVKAGISRSYLSELENGTGNHKRVSAEALYAIGKALGVAMSELLGKPFITAPTKAAPPPSLREFASKRGLPDADVQMLSGIRFRGEPPRSPERWAFIYDAIRASASMDPAPRYGQRRARPKRARS